MVNKTIYSIIVDIRNVSIFVQPENNNHLLQFNNLFKLLSITGVILLIFNLIILINVVPLGYVIDIYSMLPSQFYISLIICFCIGVSLLFTHKKIFGLFILIFLFFEILIIPYMMGYHLMGRWDDLTYVGEYLQISNSGKIADWDIYPASLIVGSILKIISGVPARIVSFILPILFSYLFVLGLILFTRKIFNDYRIILVSIASSFILYLGPYNFLNTPHAIFFATMPLYLYCLIKTMSYPSKSMQIILIIFTLLIPFTHPYIVFFALCVILFYFIIGRINVFKIGKLSILNFCILLVEFVLWFIYQNTLLSAFRGRYEVYTNTVSTFAITSKQMAKAQAAMSITDLFKFVSLYYGRFLIPAVVIFLSIIYVIIYRKQIKGELVKSYSYLTTLYIFLIIVELIVFFNPLITHEADRMTNLNFIVFAQVPLFSFAISILIMKNRPNIKNIITTVIILALIWSLSLFGVLYSPNISQQNNALTYNEVNGMNWLNNVKIDLPMGAPCAQLFRFDDLAGNQGTKYNSYNFPDHFGYSDNSESLKQILPNEYKNSYVILSTYDELLYQCIPAYTRLARYTADDFIRFRNDYSVNKIYASKNIEIYNV